jgi:hypothetical protein
MYLGTGIHTDDYIHLINNTDWTLIQLLTLNITNNPKIFVSIPTFYYDFIQHYVFNGEMFYYDLVKAVTSIICIVLIYPFAKTYMNSFKALYFSTLFVLFPLHDSTNYSTINHHYIIVPALSMYSHYLLTIGRLKTGFITAFFASFWSYVSPPFIFGLSIIFFRKRKIKEFFLYIFPAVLYFSYFIYISTIFDINRIFIGRINSIEIIFKHFLLQLATFGDTFIGPSFWLKLYFSIMELSLFSLGVGVIITYLFIKNVQLCKVPISRDLLYSSFCILFISFIMFSLTGRYPQIAFNLGNRVTIYGSFFLAINIIMFFMSNKKTFLPVFLVLLFSILGISDHWKNWEVEKQNIFENISSNEKLTEINADDLLFVSYNHYSQLGKISHVELFPDKVNANAIFMLAKRMHFNVFPINKRFFMDDDILMDRKFKTKIKIGESIYVYNSSNDNIIQIPKEKINDYISDLPLDTRHWVQLLNNNKFIGKIVIYLMPRVKYAFL